jgi:hypothetical protein
MRIKGRQAVGSRNGDKMIKFTTWVSRSCWAFKLLSPILIWYLMHSIDVLLYHWGKICFGGSAPEHSLSNIL